MRRIALAGVAVTAGLAVAASVVGCGPDRAGPAGQPRVCGRRSLQPCGFGRATGPERRGRLLVPDQMMDRYAAGSDPPPGAELHRRGAGTAALHRPQRPTTTRWSSTLTWPRGPRPDGRGRRSSATGCCMCRRTIPLHDGRIRAAYAPTPAAQPGRCQAHRPGRPRRQHGLGRPGPGPALRGHRPEGVSEAERRRSGTGSRRTATTRGGAGGYTGGETADGQKIEWKSTEHNIDLYALFSLSPGRPATQAWSAGRPGRGASSRRCGTAKAARLRCRDDQRRRDVSNKAKCPKMSIAGHSWRCWIPRTRRRSPGIVRNLAVDRGTVQRRELLPRRPHRASGSKGPRTWPTRWSSAAIPGTPRRRPGTWPTSPTPRRTGRTATVSGSSPHRGTGSATARAAATTRRCTPGRPPGTSWRPRRSTPSR